MKTVKVNGSVCKSVKKPGERYNFHLFIAGETPKAVLALKNLKLICDKCLNGNYHISVIDLVKKPQMGRVHQILAIPTLMRMLPLPVRQVIGDLSDTSNVLLALGINRNN